MEAEAVAPLDPAELQRQLQELAMLEEQQWWVPAGYFLRDCKDAKLRHSQKPVRNNLLWVQSRVFDIFARCFAIVRALGACCWNLNLEKGHIGPIAPKTPPGQHQPPS